jgi:hypothetical protein
MSFAPLSRALAHGLLSVMLVVALQATPTAATSAPEATQRQLRCEPPALGRDKLTVVCALDAAAAPQSVHIKVHFTGSHDDTTASMEVTIGDAPVACDAGSKTSTEREDGYVTLDCRFTASVEPGAATIVRASAKWFHAQYLSLEVDGRRP